MRPFTQFTKMAAREIKNLLKEVIHGLISPSPYPENSSQAVRDFQSQRGRSPLRSHRPPDPRREIDDALAAHNSARRSAPGVRRLDLKWSRSLEASAHRWADYLAASGGFRHGDSPFPPPYLPSHL
jgi:hypothetical protein